MRLARRRAEVGGADTLTRPDDDVRLLEVLVAQGVLGAEQVEGLRLAPSGKDPMPARLVATGLLTEEALAAALAAHHGVDLADFAQVSPDPVATGLLRPDRAREFGVVPLTLEDADTVLVAAFLDPAPERVARLEQVVGRRIRAVVATVQGLERALSTAYPATDEVVAQVHQFEARDALRRETADLDPALVNEDAPVVKVVHSVLTQALRDRASDVHVEPFGERLRIRYRIDGALTDVLDLPGSIGPALVSRIKVMADLNIVERRRPQDGQISTSVEGREVDIRVSTTPVVGGEKVVMRLLDKSRPLFDLAKLGMPEDIAERFRRLVFAPYGMVICAGPTGGGKTTTLYASLSALDSVDRNIMTIEDPVEYTFDTINQIQLNEQAGMTFAAGLRSILRQDPDVILVGEIRDAETARIAVQSALTGHFVLSSLHATEAVSALYRLLDMGIEGFLIASSVSAIVAQRLVRRSCTSCLEVYDPSHEELVFLAEYGGEDPVGGFRRGAGCHLCAHTGYLERIGVYELLEITDELRELIVSRAPHDQVRRLARSQGMATLQEEGVRLVSRGVTTASEVMRSIYVAGA